MIMLYATGLTRLYVYCCPLLFHDEDHPKLTFSQYAWGFCFVTGVPIDPEKTKELIERIAFIRLTHYGNCTSLATTCAATNCTVKVVSGISLQTWALRTLHIQQNSSEHTQIILTLQTRLGFNSFTFYPTKAAAEGKVYWLMGSWQPGF